MGSSLVGDFGFDTTGKIDLWPLINRVAQKVCEQKLHPARYMFRFGDLCPGRCDLLWNRGRRVLASHACD